MWRNFRFQCMTDVEKFEISPHAEEFQLFPHNRCGKMWNFAKFGGILHISTWQMWRNPKFTLFCCCKICFVTNYAVFAKSVLARFTRFCVEKNWAKNWIGGEKMTNMRYACYLRYNCKVLERQRKYKRQYFKRFKVLLVQKSKRQPPFPFWIVLNLRKNCQK